MPVKIIFLDIDGVINTYDNMHVNAILRRKRELDPKFRQHYFDERTVNWLKYIVAETDAKIVISSTWRKHRNFDEMWAARKMPDVVIGKTPGSHHGWRGFEIREWMEKFGEEKIFSYVILDDDRDMLPEQWRNFIHVPGEFGIDMRIARRAIQVLDHPPVPEQWLFRSQDP